jgi:muramidase (phage lysozyme)
MEPSVRDRVLAAISSTESPGYDVMYGGGKFTDYSNHPHARQTHGGISSDAAGKYQFLGSTWDEQQKKYGYKDFSPESQDEAAWNYAKDIYARKTGNADLEEALASNDPARVNAAAAILNQTWTSLPGGKEQSKGYGNKSFWDVYSNAQVAPKQATGGATAAPTGQPGKSTEKKKSLWETFGEGISDFAKGAKPMTYNIDPGPQAALVASKSMPIADQSAVDAQRQRLAQMMARLNQPSGPPKLWG